MKLRISKSACNALLKAPAGSRDVTWDDEIAGFGVRRNAEGTLSFVLKYRVRGNPAQFFQTIGAYPTILPDAARERAREIRTAARLGRDLLADERAARASEEAARQEAEVARAAAARRSRPVADLLDAWRAATEAELAQKHSARRPTAYERELLRVEAAILRPAIGLLRISDIDSERLQALINAEARRSPSTGRNLRALIVRFVRAANDRFALEGLPVRWPTRYELQLRGRVRPRDHRFTLDEAAALWIGAGAMGRRGALVRFILLTACRRSEAQRVEWSHLTLDDPVSGPYWQQPAHLTKNGRPHRVPLSPAAVALLRWLPPRATKKSGRANLVFAGEGNRPIGGWTDIRRKLLELAGVDDGTLHDIRRTVVSTLGDHGFDPQVVDTLLNHAAATTMGGVMGVYQRSEFWSQRRRAIELWADLLFERVHHRLRTPLSRESWGFSEPFEEVRLRRPKQRPAPPAVASAAAPASETSARRRGRARRTAA